MADFEIGNPLNDPFLELVRAGDPRPLATADDWQISPAAAARSSEAARAGAFPLRDNSRDASLLITLDPGAYTVVTAPVTADTGILLLEIYALD